MNEIVKISNGITADLSITENFDRCGNFEILKYNEAIEAAIKIKKAIADEYKYITKVKNLLVPVKEVPRFCADSIDSIAATSKICVQ